MGEAWVAGVFALLGVALGSLPALWTAHIERKERQRTLKREKFEALCENMMNSIGEVQQMLSLSGTAAISALPPTASVKAHYIAMIYFPEIAASTLEYNNALANFRAFLFGRGWHPTSPSNVIAQAMSQPQFEVHYQDLQLKRARVESELESSAKKYTR